MKTCKYCKIEVGGNGKKCPLCQSTLTGEEERPYFPKPTALKIQSFFYKIQLFIVFVVIVGSLGAQYLMGVEIFGIHWSLLITMWLASWICVLAS